MSMRIPIVVAHWSIQALDLDLEEVGRAARVPVAELSHLTYEQSVALWQAAEAILEDPTIGHRCGVQVRPHELGPFGGIVAHAATLGQALRDLASVLPLVLPGQLRVEPAGEGLAITYARAPSPTGSRHGVESMFATMVAHARHCARRSFPLHAVTFDHPAPSVGAEVYEHFYGVPVGWKAKESRVVFGEASLSLPMTAANPALSRLLLEHAEESLGAVSGIERRASRALAAALHLGEPTLVATAREMGVGERTLQRQLDVAGVSFRDLRNRVLRLHAEQLLRDPSLSVEAVAAACGYDSRTGFDRAFRGWTGQTPAAFRRALSDDPS